MKRLLKEDLEHKTIGDLYKLRDNNFNSYVQEVNEVKAKYKALLEADLKNLETDFNENFKLIIYTIHQAFPKQSSRL